VPILKYKERTLQTHSPGCWRWADHWQCCVELVEELEEIWKAAGDVLDACTELYDGTSEEVPVSREKMKTLDIALARFADYEYMLGGKR